MCTLKRSSLSRDGHSERPIGCDLGSLAGDPPSTLVFLCSLLLRGKRAADAWSAHMQCSDGVRTTLYCSIVYAGQLHLDIDRGRAHRRKVGECIRICG